MHYGVYFLFHTSFLSGSVAVCHATIILGCNKIQNGDILVPAYPGCSVKWPLNECLL